MLALTIADTTIRTDVAGRYCLNDLHRAAGGAGKDKPGNWLASNQTRALIGELEGGLLESQHPPLATVNDGRNNGTYAAKELVYAYAMWISPVFHLKVIRAYDAMVSKPALPDFTDPIAAGEAWLVAMKEAKRLSQEKEQAEAALRVAAPKVELADNFLAADNGVEGNVAVKALAREFNIGRNRLYAILRARGFFMEDNLPYQQHVDAGRFFNHPSTYTDKDGQQRQTMTVRFTAKGIAHCRALLQRHYPELARPSTSRELAAA